jgi:pimeloyl-ACP methyl ester carboxylesterase
MDVRRRNRVTVTGPDGAPAVMLAHGFGCDQNMWRLVLPVLERDFRVVLFDHVGAGRSDLSSWSEERYASLDGYAEDVLEICAELALGPVVFVGHSVSAMIGVLAAAAEPERFSGLVLLTPSPCYIDDPAAGYRGGFSAEDIEELLASLEHCATRVGRRTLARSARLSDRNVARAKTRAIVGSVRQKLLVSSSPSSGRSGLPMMTGAIVADQPR